MPSGEKGSKARPWDMTGYFLRSGLNQQVAETRRFLTVVGELQRGFSAVQTVWRRAGDSNHRYRFEWRKSRRLRDLQVFHLFSRVGWPGRITALWQTGAVSGLVKRRMPGDSAVEIGLYDAPQAAKLVRA
jgi:hypothetical protein